MRKRMMRMMRVMRIMMITIKDDCDDDYYDYNYDISIVSFVIAESIFSPSAFVN